jgi:hypothetical protein
MRPTAPILPLVALAAVLAQFTDVHRAGAVPLYAARQGLTCQSCHFDPNGGGPRNEFGFAFARNRHELQPDTSGMWKDLDLTNRVGDRMPVYLGVNQRFMLLANTTTKSDSLDRLGFFSMENALYIVFQPHSRLTLVYDRDGFNDGATTQDAFGMISGFPANGYLKAGRFRTPFGLRMDDHTVATRHSFLDFQSGRAFLPYDPRRPDMGFELGVEHGAFFGRAALTNGAADPFGPEPFAEAVTAKLGYNHSRSQAAVSFYDDYLKDGAGPFKRATRWDLYALTHWGRLAFIGDVAAGTDLELAGTKRNLLAGFAEADYAVHRAINLRVRYDLFQADRDGTMLVRPGGSRVSRRDLATYQRYALEGEFLPMPFAELRWVLRFIDPVASADALGHPLKTEKQAYLQCHFSY